MALRVVIASSSHLAFPTIELLRTMEEVEIVGFLSTPDKPKGRNRRESPNPFAAKITEEGLEVHKPKSDTELMQLLQLLSAELVVVIAYGKLIKEPALKTPALGWVNLHFSLLPAFRGAAPVQRSIQRGESRFGYSIFQIDRGMDSGPVYLQEEARFPETACATEVLDELSKLGAKAFPSVIRRILNHEQPMPQQGQPSFAPKFDKSETHLDLSKSGEEVFNQIKAFTRTPGVWLQIDGRRVLITSARMVNEDVEDSSLILRDDSLILGIKDFGLELVTVIPEGRREMTGSEFARGLRLVKESWVKVQIS